MRQPSAGVLKRAIIAVAVIMIVSRGARAQSLGELAQKTAADRAQAKAATANNDSQAPAATSKTYTNADLRTVSEPRSTTRQANVQPETNAADQPERTANAPAAPKSLDGTTEKASTDSKHDEAYWKDRLRPLWTRLDADRTALAEGIRRVDTYQAAVDGTRHMVDGTVYVDRSLQDRLLAAQDEMGRLAVLVKTDNEQIADIEEEARRANVIPGWVRR